MMMKCFALSALVVGALSAQQPEASGTTQPLPTAVSAVHRRAVPAGNVYAHIITVVPFTGKGTYDDPKRPMYLPPKRNSSISRNDILGFMFVSSDDGKSAIVEYVAADRGAFSQILSDKSLKIFEKGKDVKEDIETELKKHKKTFSLDNFGVTVR